jgi:predicted HAD superfamily hydrolase
MNKIGRIFYQDWIEARFVRDIEPAFGAKIRQIDKAREISILGEVRYREKYKAMFQEGKLTKKQWETIRNFARSWPKEKEKYKEIEREEEKEFKEKFLNLYQVGSFIPFSKSS